MNNPEYLTLEEVKNEMEIPLPLLMKLIRFHDFPTALIDGRRYTSREALEGWCSRHQGLVANIARTI